MLDGSIWTPVGRAMIRDIVRGFETILGNEKIVRMSHINQLSFVNTTYPGAQHKRIEHLLGTAALADEIARRLDLNESERTRLRFYGLVHDIGHTPFSHALEPLLIELTGKTHNHSTGDRVNEMFADIENCGLDFGEIRKLVETSDPRYQIVRSHIGADKLDYTARDMHHIGLGDISGDVRQIMNGLRFDGHDLGVDGRYVEIVERFVQTMTNNYRDVYMSPHNILWSHLLRKATLAQIMHGGLREDRLWEMTDDGLERVFITSMYDVVERIYEQIFSPVSPKIPYVPLIKFIPEGAANRNGNRSLAVQPLSEGNYISLCNSLGTTLQRYGTEDRIARDTGIMPWEVVITITFGKRMEPPRIPVFYGNEVKYLFDDNPSGRELMDAPRSVEAIDVYVKGDRTGKVSRRLTTGYIGEAAASAQQRQLSNI